MNNWALIVASIIISVGLIIAGGRVDVDTIVKVNKECAHNIRRAYSQVDVGNIVKINKECEQRIK